jgi:hypothetical protein
MARFEDLKEKKFGRLQVIKQAEHILRSGGRKRVAWLCLCECGNTCIIETHLLKSGKTKSCGCLKVEKIRERCTKHNESRGRLYSVWIDIKKRCYNPKYKQYKDYGGRGIKVCDEWLHDFSSFKEFALAHGYNSNAKYGECTIDRIDVNGNYCPENCRFVDMKTQCNNKRREKNGTI